MISRTEILHGWLSASKRVSGGLSQLDVVLRAVNEDQKTLSVALDTVSWRL